MTRLLLLLLLASPVAAEPLVHVVGQTGTPELAPSGRTILVGEPAQRFFQRQKRSAAVPGVPGLQVAPEGLSDTVRFGSSWTVGPYTVCWIWDNAGGADILRVDWNANGDLTDDGILQFADRGGTLGSFMARTVQIDEAESYDIIVDVRIEERDAPGDSKQRVLRVNDRTLRRGVLNVRDRELNFGLLGQSGLYNEEHHVVFFDFNEDGDFEIDNPYTDERYEVGEGFVNIDQVSYSFEVDSRGDSLAVTFHPEMLPDRPTIAPGYAAPEFAANDLNRQPRSLSNLLGHYVLLDFWTIGCRPCVDSIPTLIETYRTFQPRGFEMLSINSHNPTDVLQKFVREHEITWPQIQQADFGGPIMQSYRVRGWPAYFLIDPYGYLLATGTDAEEMRGYLEQLLPEPPEDAATN